ncbi:MAG: hypothetical protein M3449_02465 [Acidobacteriota bacterium]|nr:hypothetical protein [Blastocatellia bacterium]MDQ3489916.1 hypothetical protein [Acidobacteriota bacterium]
MQIILFLAITLVALGTGCGNQTGGNDAGSDTPTEAYKRLYSAVKAKDIENIKNEMSKKSQDFAITVAQRQNNPVEKVFENGFTATTFAETLPEIRDERVNADMGSVEVWNAKDSIWEDLPFVAEDGSWKFAIGELFAGSFKSPGKGRAAREREAANVMANAVQQTNPATNSNSNSTANTKFDGPQVEPETGGK